MAQTDPNTSSHSEPITGPFPDGDSRNITLAQSGNAFEPERTGPQEPTYRREGAAQSVLGGLALTELKPGAEAPSVNDNPGWVQIGKDKMGDALNAMTPGSKTSSVMGRLLDTVGEALDLDVGSASDGVQSEESHHASGKDDTGERAARYAMSQDPQPGAASATFGRPGGGLEEPVLQEDWNPATRNSDDLSR
jgi:hypothetical protein